MDRRNMMRGLVISGAGFSVMTPSLAAPDLMVKTLAEQFAGTLSAHDIDAFAALFADDFVNHQRTAAVPPPPVGTRPKDATVAYFASRLKGMPDLDVSIEAMVGNADMFAASFVYEGTHQGVYFGIAPTGKKLRFTSCDIFRVADGKIAEHWGMGDIAGMLAQLKS